MKTYIALFRGINVGGHNTLPMKELTAVLEGLGLRGVETYLQSGNVVFQGEAVDTPLLAKSIGAAIGKSHGFEPWVRLLEMPMLEAVIRGNPYPEAEAVPGTLYVNFLASVPSRPDLDGLEKRRAARERFLLVGDVLYLHAPDGIGRSRLAAALERLLGVPMTSRNWTTVRKLGEMARAA